MCDDPGLVDRYRDIARKQRVFLDYQLNVLDDQDEQIQKLKKRIHQLQADKKNLWRQIVWLARHRGD